MKRRDLLGTAGAVAGLHLGGAGLARPALAQAGAFPNRPIRIVIPFAPGGGVDAVGRTVAQRMQEALGTPVVVENRAGGNATIGGLAVQQAAPDGYTLLLSASTHVMARQVLRRAPYDPLADFTPVALIGQAPLLLVVPPGRPQTDLTGIVADARAHPDRWSCATAALGAPGHLATLLFMKLAGLDLTVVPYRGTAPALTDVAAGNVGILIDAMLTLLPLSQSGGVKPVAITATRRSALAPAIPTAAEAGLPGLEFATWYGIWGPKGLSPEVLSRLDSILAGVMRNPATIERAAALGLEPGHGGPAELSRLAAAEVARNAELLRSANFQPE